MTEQEIKNIPIFIADLQKMSQAAYLACDAEVACDISLKINNAIKLINRLAKEKTDIELLAELLKRNGHSEAANKVTYCEPHRSALIQVGKDNSAEIVICEEALDIIMGANND